MSKFYTSLRVVSLFCLATLFNQGPLFCQQAWVSGYNTDTNQDYSYEMIWNDPEYSLEGFLSGYAYVSTNDDPYTGAYGGNLFFPSGNIYSDNGNPEPIPSGYYILTLNTATGDYMFESSNNCYGSNSQVSLSINGFTPQFFCDSGSLYASLTIDQYVFSSFNGLDFQWFRNGVAIPGANQMLLENVSPSLSESEVYMLVATCPLNNQTLNSNEWTFSMQTLSLEISDSIQPIFCQPIVLHSIINTGGQSADYNPDILNYQWFRNGTPIPGANEVFLENVYPSSSEPESYTLVATCTVNNATLTSNEWVLSLPSYSLQINEIIQPVLCEPIDIQSDIYAEGISTEYNPAILNYQWFRNGIPIPGLSENTEASWNFDVSVPSGWTEYLGVGITRYSSGQSGSSCRLDATGDYVMVEFGNEPSSVSYYLKGQGSGSSWQGTFTVEESADGSTFTPLHTFTGAQLSGASYTLFTDNPAAGTRYIRWYFTEKISGYNVALDEIILITNIAGSDLSDVTPSASEVSVFTLLATCPLNGETLESNEVSLPPCYNDSSSPIDYLLVQNVTTTGNIPGQSIQVQFDLNWGNTWRDDVNWDAVWIFMKYKNAQGLWQHAKVSPTGFDHGEGTPNLIEPTADQMGAFVRLAVEGQGNFSADGMQLRWNYGADGLASVSGLEVRVFAIEMVYHPQGDFSMSVGSAAPGNKIPVINSRLSPVLSADGVAGVRIKGDAGIDLDANGMVENTIYPTGYYPFYMFKYEMSEQQYADFLNCLTPTQRTTLGVAGSTITQTAGQYFAAAPNKACAGADVNRLMAYADWSGLRPMSYLEFHKAFNGAKTPNGNAGNCGGEGVIDASGTFGAGVYGVKGLSGNVMEPYARLSSTVFSRSVHGNGAIDASGLSNETTWLAGEINWIEVNMPWWCGNPAGFRLCRTAE